MTKLIELKANLRTRINPEKVEALMYFFKTDKGKYGEGDKFLGVTMPEIRNVAKEFKNLSLAEIETLLKSEWHEERMVALIILVSQFEKANEAERKKFYEFYLANTKRINNWDLVDSSAEWIVGEYLLDKPRDILFKLAKSNLIWDRRIAMIATFRFIHAKDPKTTFELAEILLHDKEDLIQKAVGWMIKEIGKNSGLATIEPFLLKHYKVMPRTMLRYSIEKFPEEKRKFYLGK